MNRRRRREHLQAVSLSVAHLDAVLRIEEATFPSPWSRGVFAREIVEPLSHAVCLLRNGECIGYGCSWYIVDEMHISNLAIAADRRERGYGSWLLAAMLRQALAAGMASATLEVRELNAAAQALYRRFGFGIAGRRPGYYQEEGEDALIMWNRDLRATVAGFAPDLGVETAVD